MVDLGDRRAISRRTVLRYGVAGAGATTSVAVGAQGAIGKPESMLVPGEPFRTYGQPSASEDHVRRIIGARADYPLAGASNTPLHLLEGIVTPNGLHFERHHNGVPNIDPGKHRVIIHGMVARPLAFSIDALRRYPMETHSYFIECSGNSALNSMSPTPVQANAGILHGLFSVSEWTGVKLSTLLHEAGVDPAARWVIAEGADSAAFSRSVPLAKCLDDALLALYQNGEAIRPEQGYPARLILPGYEGSTQIKWLHRLKLTAEPAHSREETAHYTQLMRDGRARQFNFEIGPKSVILKPSVGLNLQGAGLYEISGLAWSGAGRIKRVEVSTDGGSTWAEAPLDGPALPKSGSRFRMAWRWSGRSCVLLSRAFDDRGGVQPMRSEWVKQYAPGETYHNNAIQAWSISSEGKVSNAYV